MKKEHRFKEGDKVFAKVKGYPPWPAVVLEDNAKKYKVKFYGTGEIGQIKQEDLFYYTKNKQKLLKPSKRKDFNDSISEIEKAIEESGTDGDPGFSDEKDEDSTSNDTTINDSEAPKKRKRAMSVSKSVNESKNALKKRKNSSADKSRSSSPSETTNGGQVSTNIENSELEKSNSIEIVEKPESVEETELKPEPIKKPDRKDFVLQKELEAFVTFGDYVGNHKDVYSKMPVEPRFDSELQIFPFVKDSRSIGVRLHKTWPLKNFENEFERAIYDKEISQQALDLKEAFNFDQLAESPNLFFEDLGFEEDDLDKFYSEKLMVIKEEILEKLKIESTLLDIDAKIKVSLNLKKAEPKEAISLLEEILKLDLDAIMLKKHAQVVDMVRRLKKYIGNVESWNLTDEEKKTFRKDAEEIRKTAMKVYVKFMHIIGKPAGAELFWDAFNDMATKFREEIKDISEAEFYMLSSEPNSRKNFLTNYFIKDIPLNIPQNISLQNSNNKES